MIEWTTGAAATAVATAGANATYNALLYLLNLATEPIGIAELYHYLEGKKFQNIISTNPPYYDFKTKHDTLMGGKRGYIFDKDNVLAEIKTFIQEQSC